MASVVCVVHAVAAAVLRFTYLDDSDYRLLGLSGVVAGIIAVMTIVTTVGLKVRPTEGTASDASGLPAADL